MTRETNKTYLLLVCPSLIVITAITLGPILYAFFITFHDLNLLEGGNLVWAGINNYLKIFSDDRVRNTLWVTARWVILCISGEMLFGLIISFYLDRKFFAKSVIRALIVIPMFMTPVVVGVVWRFFFDTNSGIINYYLGLFGIPMIDWLGDAAYALYSIIIVDIWQSTPFIILLVMTSLDNISTDLYEAAMIDGANELQTIFHIKLPSIVPTIIITAVLRCIDLVKAFDVIFVMTKGGPGISTDVFTLYAYTVGFKYFRMGYSITLTFVCTVIILTTIGWLIRRTQRI